jgi:succinyl-CoA synthetase alpha subunit
MAIFLDASARVIVQGITGRVGSTFAGRMRAHYSNLVGGVSPGRAGSDVHRVPVFGTVDAAVQATVANTSVVVVAAQHLEGAVREALDAGIRLIWCYADGVPTHTTMRLVHRARMVGARLIGPNSAGIVSPGKASASELNEDVLPLRPGSVGIASKSGSLAYDIISDIYARTHQGQSTVVCVGGDPILGTSLLECVKAFEADEETKVVVLIGEIGGTDELEVAQFARTMRKPLVAHIAGRSAPPGKRMGHAGALINGRCDTVEAKVSALRESGASVAETFDEIPELVAQHSARWASTGAGMRHG